MPAVGRFSGTPASISANEEPHTVAIDDEPFELGDLGDDADRVGELRRGRQHRPNRPPGELAVADFAPARRAHAAGFADRVGGEVVVEQEALLVGPLERVDVLLVLAGAERRHHQRLGLAAGEQSRAVGARQHADLGEDRPDRRQVAAVDAALVVEDVPAHHLRLRVVQRFVDRLGGELGRAALRQQRRLDLGLDRVDGGVALLLLGDRIGSAQIGFGDRQHGLFDRRLVRGVEFARLLGRFLGEADDRRDHRLERRVAGHHRLQHRLLGQLLGFRLDHQHGVGGAGDDQIELRLLHLFDRRIGLDLAADHADPGPADRPHERHARQRQRRRGGDQAEDVGIVLHVVAEHGDDHLRIAAEVIGEQRPDRPVDEPRGQGFAIGHAAFALQVAAGNAARRVGLFLVVDGQREEVLAGLGGLGGDDGGEYRRVAPARPHRAVGLTRDASGFEHELAPAERQFLALNIEHHFILSNAERMRGRSPTRGCEKVSVIGKTARGWRIGRQPLAILPQGVRGRTPIA